MHDAGLDTDRPHSLVHEFLAIAGANTLDLGVQLVLHHGLELDELVDHLRLLSHEVHRCVSGIVVDERYDVLGTALRHVLHRSHHIAVNELEHSVGLDFTVRRLRKRLNGHSSIGTSFTQVDYWRYHGTCVTCAGVTVLVYRYNVQTW